MHFTMSSMQNLPRLEVIEGEVVCRFEEPTELPRYPTPDHQFDDRYLQTQKFVRIQDEETFEYFTNPLYNEDWISTIEDIATLQTRLREPAQQRARAMKKRLTVVCLVSVLVLLVCSYIVGMIVIGIVATASGENSDATENTTPFSIVSHNI